VQTQTADRRRADYGLDAPGVVRNLLIAGAVGVLILVGLIAGLWSMRTRAAMALSPVMFAGLACGMTGLWMVWHSRRGKVRSRDKHLGLLTWRGDERVLDVGCGRGLFLIGAAKRLTAGGRAVGVDIWQAEDLSGNTQQATLENARWEGVADRVEVQTGDARELPFAERSFDVVVSSMALHNIYESAGRDKAITEIARVLKPGGRVLIVDIRHAPQYADGLRRAGLAQVRVRRPVFSYLAMVVTMGAVRFAVVTGE
jgi:ubiquinone/menaquinone biosynthesis C-methylase UbiE